MPGKQMLQCDTQAFSKLFKHIYPLRNLWLLPEQYCNTGNHDICKRQGEHNFPAQMHQLVVTQTREGCPNPDKEEHESKDLEEEVNPAIEGPTPATQENGRSDC